MNPMSKLRPTFQSFQLTMNFVSPNISRNQIGRIFRGFGLGVVLAMALVQSVMAADTGNPYEQESAVQRDARMKWFREARFGMFIHWGFIPRPPGSSTESPPPVPVNGL